MIKVSSVYSLDTQDHLLKKLYIVGKCMLEYIDRNANRCGEGRFSRDKNVLTMGDSGVLSEVEIQNGRAIGTLGKEEQIKFLRRSMIPKKLWSLLVDFKFSFPKYKILGFA